MSAMLSTIKPNPFSFCYITVRMNEELTFENRVINKEGNIVHLGLTVTESRTNKVMCPYHATESG